MNLLLFPLRRPIMATMLAVAFISGGALVLKTVRAGSLPFATGGSYASIDQVSTAARQVKDYAVSRFESFFKKHEEEEHHEEARKVVLTSPKSMDVTITKPFVCQIRAQRNIDVCALDSGYLQEIAVREGQAVKAGDVMFKILPVLYKAKRDAELAEARLAELEYSNTERLFREKAVVSENEVKLFEARRARARAKAELAQAELNFTEVKAPFDGIVDRLREREGSLIKEGDTLTTLSDNSVMWVYFNVPETRYLEYMASSEQEKAEQIIELQLANHKKFPHLGTIDPARHVGAIEAQFNNETGNLAFRADFPNPDRLLRHGQTGTILIHRKLKNVLVIPQRATFDLLDKQYVWVVGEDNAAHQRLITVQQVLDDIFVIKSGLEATDRIVLDGVREVEEGKQVAFEVRKPEEALKNQKFHAE